MLHDIPAFQDRLHRWFRDHQRPLPWREGYEPYQVWISEIMLQQTRMERAVDYFRRWMRRFPDPASIAEAEEDEVLRHWEGLGYYSRARNLRRAARLLVERHGGRLPADPAELLKLPGIGPYTAGAIASLAFGRAVPVVDANVERVFSRLLDIDQPVKQPEAARTIRDAAETILPEEHPRDHNQALMELGALVCRPKNPRCGECPVASHCAALRLDIVADRPLPVASMAIVPLEVASGVLVHRGRVFVQKRLPEGAWAGLWEFPGGRIEAGESPARAVAREFLEETGFLLERVEEIGVVRHAYTRYRVRLHCFFAALGYGPSEPRLTAAQEFRWVLPEELAEYALPAGHRKLADSLAADPRFLQRLKDG